MHDERRPSAEDRVVSIQPAERVAGSPPFFRQCASGLRKYQHRGRCRRFPPTVPRLRICGVAASRGRLGDRGVLLANDRMFATSCSLVTVAPSRRPAVGSHLDSVEFLQSFQIDQRGWRYDILLHQIDHIDPACNRDVASSASSREACANIGRRDHLESIHATSNPYACPSAASTRSGVIGRSHRHAYRVVDRACDRCRARDVRGLAESEHASVGDAVGDLDEHHLDLAERRAGRPFCSRPSSDSS